MAKKQPHEPKVKLQELRPCLFKFWSKTQRANGQHAAPSGCPATFSSRRCIGRTEWQGSSSAAEGDLQYPVLILA